MRLLISFFFLGLATASSPAQEADEYKILKPTTSQHLVSSEHFVARWNDRDNVQLTDAEIKAGLSNLEDIWNFYIGTVGFPGPYADSAEKYKVSINLSDHGLASASGTGTHDPAMWLNYRAFKDAHALSHEFTHTLQFCTEGLRDSVYVGWFWECHAEWMAHQMDPHQVGCSQQLLDAPHLYYGSTRDRYGNWLFLEYLKDEFGYKPINEMWTKAEKPVAADYREESPLGVLMRNMNWSVDQLNDQFGRFAMHNVTWDYKNGDVYRKLYGSYSDDNGLSRHRVSQLEPVNGSLNLYAIPAYHAPQRLGYNLVRIKLDSQASLLTVQFNGLVQDHSAVASFQHQFEHEPSTVPPPDSGWRWGVVLVGADGKPIYSPIMTGDVHQYQCAVTGKEDAWLVVAACPKTYQKIEWDQTYYSIYRYPWTVEINGGKPGGIGPAAPPDGQPGKPHANGGGWVADTATVDPSAFVGPDAEVLDHAQVLGQARIEGHAVVSGGAQVCDRAVVKDWAAVTGSGVIAGEATLSDEAYVTGGLVDEQAALGAMTIVAGDSARTHIHGKAVIKAVMNSIEGFDVGGTAQLLGDVELHAPLSQGVFYGMVTPEMVNDPRYGALRTDPSPEVTIDPVSDHWR